jgi:hypothetical protein
MRFIVGIIVCACVLTAAAADDKRLVFSTYHGGDRNDDALSVAVSREGFIYVTGETESRDLNATPLGGKPLTAAVFKGYLTKYAPNGKEIVWRYLIGGTANTVPQALALDPAGNVWVCGTTGARDLPLVNPVQATQTGLNIAFLMKFSPDGKLLFSTLFGGDRNDSAQAIATDSKGSVYIAGRATSTKLPVKNALQPSMSAGGQDAFIAKYSNEGQLEYATYLGGTSGTDNIFAIAVGPDDALYVTGENMSPNLATENAWMRQPQPYSSYLAKISPAGDRIEYFTYIGGRGGYSKTQAVAVDAQGRAWVAGHTTSKQMPVTENALQREYAGGVRDAFLIRITADGSSADYVSYLGGSYNGKVDPDETAAALKIDARGFVYVAGETHSPDFPGRRAVQSQHAGLQDAYLIRLDPDNKEIVYSTFWGGSKKDVALGLALGPGEQATVVGESYSDDLPLANAVQTKLGSGNDAFVAQICDPWLGSWPVSSAAFGYTIGGNRPEAMELVIYSGCTQDFDISELTSDKDWLRVTSDKRTVPAKLRLDVNVDGLPAGEHKATVRITVPAAYRSTLEIPVTVTVVEPPPAQ